MLKNRGEVYENSIDRVRWARKHYAQFVQYYGSELVAVCDIDPKKKEVAMQYGMPEDGFYTSEEEFFARGKLADALIISTMDTLRYRQTMKALELGYDILLEKSIAMTLQECIEIRDKAKALGRKVVICHVLRYAPLYNKVKNLLDKACLRYCRGRNDRAYRLLSFRSFLRARKLAQ